MAVGDSEQENAPLNGSVTRCKGTENYIDNFLPSLKMKENTKKATVAQVAIGKIARVSVPQRAE